MKFIVSAFSIACIGAAATASADTVSHSVVVEASPAEVWSLIGPFCAIKNWLPPVGSCSEDGAVPPTRTLVTKDGTATFIERQIARNDAQHSYSYTFLSSPLPVSHYSSTIKVTANGKYRSTVTWNGRYTPDAGKQADAKTALDGIYTAGLDMIKSQTATRAVAVAGKKDAS